MPKTGLCEQNSENVRIISSLEFNEGKNGIENVIMKVGINVGELQSTAYCKIDSTRKRHIVRKSSTPFYVLYCVNDHNFMRLPSNP